MPLYVCNHDFNYIIYNLYLTNMSIERSPQFFHSETKGMNSLFFFFLNCNDSELFLINKENVLRLQCLWLHGKYNRERSLMGTSEVRTEIVVFKLVY